MTKPYATDFAGLSGRSAEYYRLKYAEHGDSPRGMDWKDAESQELRFETIARYIGWKPAPSVLDVGCGNGEFLAFAGRKGFSCDYFGIDVCGEMVEGLARRFGKGHAAVLAADRLPSLGRTFDYAVACGTFHVKQDAPDEAWAAYVAASVRAMHASCAKAAISTFMSERADKRYGRLHYPEANWIAALGRSLPGAMFIIDHSYPLYELTAVFLKT